MKRISPFLRGELIFLFFDRPLARFWFSLCVCVCEYECWLEMKAGAATVMNEHQNGSARLFALDDAKQAMIVAVIVTISKENTNPEDEQGHTHSRKHTQTAKESSFVRTVNSKCLQTSGTPFFLDLF